MSDARTWWETFFGGPWGDLQAQGYPAERTRAEADFIVSALALAPGARVLDIPCGEGRHSIELAARGYAATGVDFNARALALAENNASARGVHVEFVRADMRDFAAQARFDAASCFFGSFGYFGDDENLRFAANVARALVPGGRFLIDTQVTESLFPRFQERRWDYLPDGTRVLEECRYDLESSAFMDAQSSAICCAARAFASSPRSRPEAPRRSSSARAAWA
jgi:cyclopropane fatty-acyl-phospholipid synthase-like methyltransferase